MRVLTESLPMKSILLIKYFINSFNIQTNFFCRIIFIIKLNLHSNGPSLWLYLIVLNIKELCLHNS